MEISPSIQHLWVYQYSFFTLQTNRCFFTWVRCDDHLNTSKIFYQITGRKIAYYRN